MRWKTDRQLRLVATTYRNAAERPTQAVALALNTTHSHAANLIAKARLLEFLEPFDTPTDTRPPSPYLTFR